MKPCPLCSVPSNLLRAGTPYWICEACGVWFQHPLPPKTYEAGHEKDAHGNSTGHRMSDADRTVNRRLADALFNNWMGSTPGRTLDVGSKYPFLARCLQDRGCDARGLDGIEATASYADDLGVRMVRADFESTDAATLLEGEARFRLITLVHVFEHLYDPIAALRKLRSLLADDGVLFLRMPDHAVSGFERDLTPGHYTIHPFFHSEKSVRSLVERATGLTIVETYPLEGSGQRDYLLRPTKAVERKRSITLHRRGAMGDILMTLNLIPALRAKHPGTEIHYYCDRTIGLALWMLMREAGVDVLHDRADWAAELEQHAHAINLVGYPLHEGYPHWPMRQHLIRYFANEMGIELDPFILPALVARRRPLPPAALEWLDGRTRFATLQVKSKWSVYKDWPVERWAAVLAALPVMPVIQVGSADEPRIPGAYHGLLGTPLENAIALISNAALHLGVDSVMNHLTHYRWSDDSGTASPIPSVIVWGSTQPSASGYPHNTNLQLGLHCQPCFREDPALSNASGGPCDNPPGQTYAEPHHACMYGLSVEAVVNAIVERHAFTS